MEAGRVGDGRSQERPKTIPRGGSLKAYHASRWSAIDLIGDPAQKTVLDEAGFLMEAFKASTRIVGKQEVARNGIVENDGEHVCQSPVRQNRKRPRGLKEELTQPGLRIKNGARPGQSITRSPNGANRAFELPARRRKNVYPVIESR